MRNAWIIARRELGAIFVQPIAYIVAVVLLLLCGAIFSGGIASYFQAAQFGQQPAPPAIANVMGFFIFLSLFVVPAITMRLLSEEQKSGTIELLMTLPVRDGEVVLGKFLAAFIYYLSIVAFTLVYPFVLIRFGNPDIGPILTMYLGVILSVGAMIALGVFASALSQNQIVAYILSFGLILFLYLTDFFAQGFASSNETAQTILTELSFQGHSIGFARGVIEVKAIVYYVAVIVMALFAAARVLESKRWR